MPFSCFGNQANMDTKIYERSLSTILAQGKYQGLFCYKLNVRVVGPEVKDLQTFLVYDLSTGKVQGLGIPEVKLGQARRVLGRVTAWR